MTATTTNLEWISVIALMIAAALGALAIGFLIGAISKYVGARFPKPPIETPQAEQARRGREPYPPQLPVPAARFPVSDRLDRIERIRPLAGEGGALHGGEFEWRADGNGTVLVRPLDAPDVVFAFSGQQADNVAWATAEASETPWTKLKSGSPMLDRWMMKMLREGQIPNVPPEVRREMLGESPHGDS